MAIPPLVLRIIADSKGVTKGVAQAQGSLSKFQSAAMGAAKVASIALVGAGAVATKMALDYEDAFTKIDAVSNASTKQIGQWKDQVLGLAGATAQAPQELADALYFLASAGLKANQIMPTLEASAKASAAGLGETADIARLTANALNAYQASGLKAAQVTDVLVAAVREGTANPDEFADAMGRILPVASKAGISFDQIAASLATVSNIGLDVNEGVTAMRGVLSALLAPGTQAATALKDIGLSADAVRESLAEDGLLATLNLLDEAANGNIDTLRKIIPNIRAMTGAFGLTEQEASKVDKIFRSVAGSTGALDEAFETTAKGPAFRMQQAIARLKVVAIQVGQQLLPIVTQVVEAIGRWVTKFSQLDPATRGMIVKVGILVAALWPLSKIVGGLTGGILGLGKAFGLSSAAAGAWGIAIAGLGIAAFKLHGYLNMDNEKAKEWTDTILSGKSTLGQYKTAVDAVSDGHVNLIDHLDGSAQVMNALEQTTKEVTQAFYKQVAPLIENTEAGARWERQLRDSGAMSIRQKQNLAALLQMTQNYNVKLSDSERVTLEAYLATGDYRSALGLLQRALHGVLGPLKNLLSYTERQGEAAADAAQKNRRYVYWLKQIGSASPGALPVGQSFSIAPQQRAFGGPVSAMRPYIVGERGPEWFVPKVAGTIVPNGQTEAPVTNVRVFVGEQEVHDIVVKALNRAVARA